MKQRIKTLVKRSPPLYAGARLGWTAYRRLFGSRRAHRLRSWRDYLRPQPLAGYIGWLGHGNLGDEGLYEAFKVLFPALHFVAYGDEPVELAAYGKLVQEGGRLHRAVFLGGGTLAGSVGYRLRMEHALRRGNRLVAFGPGVLDPHFWMSHDWDGDYGEEMRRWAVMLRDAVHVSVRGPHSAALFAEHGLPDVPVIGDPALSICEPRPAGRPRTGVVGVNLGMHGRIWGNQAEVDAAVTSVVRTLLARGLRVEFIPMHDIDLAIGRRLQGELGAAGFSLWTRHRDAAATIARLREYDFVIAERLHAQVFSSGAGVPAVALEYRPKCRDYMASLGMERMCVRTDQVSPAALLERVDEIEADYEGVSAAFRAPADRYRVLQRQAADRVTALVLGGA